MEPSNIHNAKEDDHESEEILDLLPPRFRQISGSSTAMEIFNLINDDLISHRIIPLLDRHLRSIIVNARPGLIANRLRPLVDAAPPSPRKCSLLFRLIEYGVVSEMKFIECAIRDKRLSPFPPHKFTSLTIPHSSPTEEDRFSSRTFVEVIGHKIIWWNKFDWEDPFCYILNAELNSDRAFRALDTSAIIQQLPQTFLKPIMNVVVGDRLIVLLHHVRGTSMLSLDVNIERWSVLPQYPTWFTRYHTAVPWKGKLYIVNIMDWVVPTHFDFQRNMWVIGGDENTAFARSFKGFFPRHSGLHTRSKLVMEDRGRCMISSKSGTLYAISHVPEYYYPLDKTNIKAMDNINAMGNHPIGNIYAMDDLTVGWRQIECRKSEHTQQVDPFKLQLPKLRWKVPEAEYPGLEYLSARIKCWDINEHDILLVVVQSMGFNSGLSARYAWWIFNKDDGVKNYGCEVLNSSALEDAHQISLLKLEM